MAAKLTSRAKVKKQVLTCIIPGYSQDASVLLVSLFLAEAKKSFIETTVEEDLAEIEVVWLRDGYSKP